MYNHRLTPERLTTWFKNHTSKEDLERASKEAIETLFQREFLRLEQDKLIRKQRDKTVKKHLFNSPSLDQIKTGIQNTPPPLNIGYALDSSPIQAKGGRLMTIAGGTGHCKSTFLINCALNMVADTPKDDPLGVYYIGYEETPSEHTLKALTLDLYYQGLIFFPSWIRGFIASNFSRDYPLPDPIFAPQKYVYMHAFHTLIWRFFHHTLSKKLFILDGSGGLDKLYQIAKRIQTQHQGRGMIIVDYFQAYLLNSTPYIGMGLDKQDQIKAKCFDLRNLVDETNVSLIMGSQFNREVNSPDKLALNHLAESAHIERISDEVLGLYNLDMGYVFKKTEHEQKARWDEYRRRHKLLYLRSLKRRYDQVGSDALLSADFRFHIIKRNDGKAPDESPMSYWIKRWGKQHPPKHSSP